LIPIIEMKKEALVRYKVVITYDSEYKGYVVDVPELVGCMSQGKTIDEALINIKDAIKGWLLVEDKHGRLEISEEKEVFLGEVYI
jgi:predicted RNase H-like HicB family nuclease